MSTINELLQEGIRAAKGGQVEKARQILKRVIEQEPHNEVAWLWLSGVIETDEQRMTCLENVLAINPDHQAAQRGLQALRQKAMMIKPLPEEAMAVPTPTVSRPQAGKSGPWVAVALVALAMLVVGLWCSNRWNAIFGPGSYTSATPIVVHKPTPTIPSVLIRKIEIANGYDWWAATEMDRVELCRWMEANQRAATGSSVGWRFLFDNLNEFYQTDEPLILQEKIIEVAAILSFTSD